MAQSKSFFGLRKGSTKSLTFQVLNGKQITKDRVYNVKNPQTLAQMQQRAIMATSITAYSHMKEICDHSFEGIEVGAKSMAEFIRLNLKKLQADLPTINITSYKTGDFANNTYLVSNGSLTSVETSSYIDSTSDNESGIEFSGFGKWSEKITFKDIATGCGLSQDGMLTIMLVSQGDLFWVRLKFTKKIMESTQAITNKASLITTMKNIDSTSVEGNTNELIESIKIVNSDNNAVIHLVTMESDELGAMIKSQKSEGTWKRSKAYLYGDVINYDFNSAFNTYPINTTLLLNGGKMSTNVL